MSATVENGEEVHALDETGVVETWLKTHFQKDSVDHLVSVSW